MADRIGDDPAVAMAGDQHVDRNVAPPGHRHHQQPAVPEGEDERLARIMEPTWDLGALDRPAAGCVDDADIDRDEPAHRASHYIRSNDLPPQPGHIGSPGMSGVRPGLDETRLFGDRSVLAE